MSNFIPPARVRQEDEFFIGSLARAYQDNHWSEETLRSIAADAMRMIRHLATRYSDQSCVELNSEELEAEGRRKFIEQFTRTRILQGFPRRLREKDVVTSIGGYSISAANQIDPQFSWPVDTKEVVVEYSRLGGNSRWNLGAVRMSLRYDHDAVFLPGIEFADMGDNLRPEFPSGGAVVKSVDTKEPLVFGKAPLPPTRGDLFKWFKSCINNHIRGIVHRCRFTVRRTGRKVPPKDSKLDWNRSFKPEVSLEAASEDDHLNRAVERAASVWDSTAVSEFDTDMGAERYALFEISHPDNSKITIGDLSQGLRLSTDDLSQLAESYRRRFHDDPYYNPAWASASQTSA